MYKFYISMTMYEGSIPSLGITEENAGAKWPDRLVAPHSLNCHSLLTNVHFIYVYM